MKIIVCPDLSGSSAKRKRTESTKYSNVFKATPGFRSSCHTGTLVVRKDKNPTKLSSQHNQIPRVMFLQKTGGAARLCQGMRVGARV